MALFWLLASTLGTIVWLLAIGCHNDKLARQRWSFLLTPEGLRAYSTLRRRLDQELDLTEHTYGRAFAFRDGGRASDAIRLLDAGYELIKNTAADRISLVAGMAVYSRMVAAMLPAPSIRPRDFRLRQLSTLAGAACVVHHLLVTAGERFRLRLAVLHHGFRFVVGVIGDSTGRLRRDFGREPDWKHLSHSKDDFRTLTEHSLESFRILLMSLAAAPAEARLAWEQISGSEEKM